MLSPVNPDLFPGESMLWELQPQSGLRPRVTDIPTSIFGLFFTAVSSTFVIAAFPWGLLLPHFWIGIYFAFGHFFWDAKVRSNTIYVVTETRALVVRRWPLHRVRAINLANVAEIGTVRHKDGSMTITFGSGSTFGRRGRQGPPAFEFVEPSQELLRFLHGPGREL
jgi:hypothetical protein